MTKIEMKSRRESSLSSVMKHWRLISVAAVLLAVCLAFVGGVGAETTYYVSPTGNQDGTTVDKPSNLTSVLNLIKTGTDNKYVVLLLEGEYTDNNYVIERTAVNKATITLKAYGDANAVIKTPIIITSKYISSTTFEKLNLSGISATAVTVTHDNNNYKYSGDVVLESCNFINCDNGILVDKSSNNVQLFNVLNTSFNSISGYAIRGYFGSAKKGITISNCNIDGAAQGLWIRTISENNKLIIKENIITTNQYCIRLGQVPYPKKEGGSTPTSIHSVEITHNDLTVNNPHNSNIYNSGILIQGYIKKDILISENTLDGEELLYLDGATKSGGDIILDKNYWDGENPVGKEVPISWGLYVSPPQSQIPYYLDVDKTELYDDSTYKVDIHQPENGVVKFKEITYKELTLRTDLNNGYPKGSEVTLTINPATGYSLSSLKVIDEDDSEIEVVENKFTMPEKNVTVTVLFTANIYNIEVIDGSAEPNNAEINTEVTLIPDTKEGYTFKEWSVIKGGEITITDNKFIMPASDVHIKAVFEEIPKDNEVFSSNGGSGIGGYDSHPRTTVNGGLVDFGSSKVVKAVLLPEGSSGSVVLKVDTIEKWPKELETEYTFDISVEKLGEGMAYIHFEIPESTLESLGITPADICAYHLVDDVWVKLITTYEVKDGTVFYEAETDSFSPFKLVIEEGAAEPKAEETEPVIPPTEEPEDKPQEELPPIEPPVQPTEPESPSPILAVLAGLGAAAVLRRK